MATSDTSVTELIINKISESDLQDLVNNNNVPANQMFFTPDLGEVIKPLEFVGDFESSGSFSISIDLDTYNYVAIFFIQTSSSSDTDLGLMSSTNNWDTLTGDGNHTYRTYFFETWAKRAFGLCYISYENGYTNCDAVKNRGSVNEKITSLNAAGSSINWSRCHLFRIKK